VTRQLAYTGLLIAALILGRSVSGTLFARGRHDGPLERDTERRRFWMKQLGRLAIVIVLAAGLIVIWADDATRMASVAGIITAGVAVALQRMILSVAGYFVILRGKAFTVGDRITIGGVRGDVVSLGFMQTMVMEMGEPPNVRPGDPETWVGARQYTGRIVRITNDKIFDTPVYNYTREFPFMWEEMQFPLAYEADYHRAEQILLDVATRHTADAVRDAGPAIARLRAHYFVPEQPKLDPQIYLRMTDNWLEVSLRFVSHVHGNRALKDAMTREILVAFAEAGLSIASTTYEIVGLPKVEVEATVSS
jgi:small-conductance mechanosensitive channel